MKVKKSTKKVLIIDDEEGILDAMRIVLESEGFKPIVRATPPAIKQIIEINPDIILLDLLLRGEMGQDYCKKLKKNRQTALIPVIMLSAHSKQVLQTAVKECGAEAYLAKPFDTEMLVALIRKYLKG